MRQKKNTPVLSLLLQQPLQLLLLVVIYYCGGCGGSADATKITSSKPYGTFDQDSREDCYQLLEHCQSDLYGHIFVQCAKSCTDYLEAPGMVGTVVDEDAFYQLPPLRLHNQDLQQQQQQKKRQKSRTTPTTRKINMERFEGSVTIVAIVPLLPGMAAYYYELLCHVHDTFSPHLESIVIPIDHGQGIHIHERIPSSSSSSSVWVVEEESSPMTVPLVKHLLSVKPRNGAGTQDLQGNTIQVELAFDRVTIYIVSADSLFVERLVSPTLLKLKDKIRTYLKTIDYQDL